MTATGTPPPAPANPVHHIELWPADLATAEGTWDWLLSSLGWQLQRVPAWDEGWAELFADRYPHAGGPDHTALHLENAEGFEVELVSP